MAPVQRTPKRQKLSPSSEHESHAGPSSTSQHKDSPTKQTAWYSRSWPPKAAPITQVARESISSASNTAVETVSIIKDKVTATPSRKPSLALTRGGGTPSKALPADATTTKDHAMPESRKISKEEPQQQDAAPTQPEEPLSGKAAQINTPKDSSVQSESAVGDPVQPGETVAVSAAPKSWIGWLAGGDGGGGVKAPATTQLQDKKTNTKVGEEQDTVQPDQAKRNLENNSTPSEAAQAKTTPERTDPPAPPTTLRRSWLPLWNNATASHSAPAIASPTTDTRPAAPSNSNLADENATKPPPAEVEVSRAITPDVPQQQQLPNKSSTWVFWSREKPTDARSLKDAPREGEIAIANTDSEQKPRRASIDVQAQQKPDSPALITPGKASGLKEDKRAKNKSKDTQPAQSAELVEQTDTAKMTTSSKSATATAIPPAEAKISRPTTPTPSKKAYEHQLTPSLQETLRIAETPTLLQQIARLFWFSSTPPVPLKHLSLIKDPLRIRQALAIGVHGYFPAPLIQSVLGRPTGTSIKFAEMAARSISRYTSDHGYSCNVKTAALEGEGKIEQRVDLLWKLLLNWIDEIRKADFVMVACHSQGVPVAIMLVAKLIHFGCIPASARVGICAMAGVNMGPFPDFKSRFISGSAGELFEFSDSESKVSKDYHAALDDILRFGVRVTYVGSIDDQLVSLESSVFAPVTHPHIFRAVSIDSRIHAPSFLSHLVGFTLKLRNLGVHDHGLIRELSAPLAGSLYSGEGHSRLYEDDAIYDLAVGFALETTSMPGVPLVKRDGASTGGNPYILPFAMRGILEEDFVKSDLQNEATKLLQEFDDWKPTTKALKDVKFRLEGIRSKL